jgi:hypothetical protein
MTLNATHARVPMDSVRKAALVGGALYVITFATSIPSRILFGPVRNDPNYILGPGADGQVLFAGLLELMLAMACIGTAVDSGSAAARRSCSTQPRIAISNAVPLAPAGLSRALG